MKDLLLLVAQIHIDGLPQTDANTAALRNVFSVALVVVGGLCVLFLLIGAGRYAASAGDSSQIKQARDTILYSVIGLIVSTSAFFVVQFVLGSINNP